ncbi:MAG TPA: NRDE family protein, partial [Casimicrobiaceae bacterium]|nr:NRDE family protein [Casimicrobiaceae bacterium]
TNVREPGRHDPRAPSRGSLVPALLGDDRDPLTALATTVAGAGAFNGFNVVAGDGSRAAFGSNRAAGIASLHPGIHGVSNAQLDTPWPKLVRAKAGVARWIASGDADPRSLWDVLGDRTIAEDSELPATGLPLERERLLSAPFIVSDTYGTRCSTIIALERNGRAHFAERSFDPDGRITGEVLYRFDIPMAAGRARAEAVRG